MNRTDWREVCEELVRELHGYKVASPMHDRTLLNRARTLLGQPEPEVVGLTNEELLSLDQLREAWNAQADAANSWDELGIDEIIWWAQRQALARWGRPAPALAGEVADEARYLIKELRDQADDLSPSLELFGLIHRAADLLERQDAPVPQLPEDAQVIEPTTHTILVPARVPVAVSEQPYKRQGWCDDKGFCWWFDRGSWIWLYWYAGFPWGSISHCLPHDALPLPSGEVDE